MDALTKSISESRAFETATRDAIRQKGVVGASLDGVGGSLGIFGNSAVQRKYNQFEGWSYAAIHALALEGAGQPVRIGRLVGEEEMEEEEERKVRPGRLVNKSVMPKTIHKSPEMEWELIEGGPLMDVLDHPNPLQDRWQFVYSCIANLNLTGIAYIVGGVNEEGRFEIYALPSSWVAPVAKEGDPFAYFRVGDPNKPQEMADLPKENVAFIKLPNPANPLSHLAPLSAQMPAVRIDQHIQYSQEKFFENGIFPSMALTIGKNPHPDIPGGGTRPLLNSAQRRQIFAAIEKVYSGFQNYGRPIILDGLIESVERLSATSTEMGWDKSEDKIRTRILSAFGVHPFLLGEPMNVGGHAQAAKIYQVFHNRVNTFLELISGAVTKLTQNLRVETEKLYIWWELCKSADEEIRSKQLMYAHKEGAITNNELRAEIGFSPVEEETNRSRLLNLPNTINSVVSLLSGVQTGTISSGAAAKILALFLQIEEEEAQAMVVGGETETEVMQEAVEGLRAAVSALGASPKMLANLFDERIRK